MCNDLDVVGSSRVGEYPCIIMIDVDDAEEERIHFTDVLASTLHAFSYEHMTHVSLLRD